MHISFSLEILALDFWARGTDFGLVHVLVLRGLVLLLELLLLPLGSTISRRMVTKIFLDDIDQS